MVVCAQLRGFVGDGEGGLGCIKKLVGGLGWEAPMWGALSPLRVFGCECDYILPLTQRHRTSSWGLMRYQQGRVGLLAFCSQGSVFVL